MDVKAEFKKLVCTDYRILFGSIFYGNEKESLVTYDRLYHNDLLANLSTIKYHNYYHKISYLKEGPGRR